VNVIDNPADIKALVDPRIVDLADAGLTTGAMAAHGTVTPYLEMLIPPEERTRIAFRSYVRRIVEGQTVKDNKGRRVRVFNSVVQRRICEDGTITEETVYERATLVEEQPEKRRKAFRSFRMMLFGLLQRFPLLDEESKSEALTVLAVILERAERRMAG